MKKEYHYYHATIKQMGARIEFNTLTDMCLFANHHHIEDVFLLKDIFPQEEEWFAIYYNNCLMLHETNGYKTLEHFETSTEKGFPSAAIYYDSLLLGYSKYEDYVLVKESGISDLTTFELIKKKGFITGFAHYKKLMDEKSDSNKISIQNINNPFELYTYAKQHNFEDCTLLINAFSKGFVDYRTFEGANELGFNDYNDFIASGKMGLRSYAEYSFAINNHIRDKQDYFEYLNLEFAGKEKNTHDKRVVQIILSKIEQGKKISLNKLNALLQKTIEEYKYKDTLEMPKWFTRSIIEVSDLADFLNKSEEVKRYGSYNADGEYFEINSMKDRAVVLDGSNVAHNSVGRTDKKVHAQNLILMIDYLKAHGFTDIIVIADASLRHRIDDVHNLEKVKKICKYLESPKETSADLFLIQYIKLNHCLIVSNDTFREWKIQDSWAAENIDFYRLTFIIKDNEVLMPDLK